MNYCPLISYQREGWTKIDCLGKDCGFADAAGECLIKQALQCYVSRERTDAAERESAEQYWLMKKDGTRTPVVFNEESNSSPLSSGYRYSIEPSSNCITTSNSFHPDDYWKGLQGGL
jgi:hypothetical protein